MTQVSKTAKTIMAAILARLQESGGNSIRIDVNGKDSGIMPLSVELVQTNVKSGYGIGNLYSFAHYYEQNGDLMRDPEIVYLVIDHRGGDAGDMDRLVIFPQMWQQDGIIGGYRELITIDSENRVGMYRPIPQRDAAQFTTLWMKNIKWQQNIKPIAAKAKFVPY